MKPETAERNLTWLLRVLGSVTLLALIAVVMPTRWMAAVNDWIGLDPFAPSPLMEYLTRSLSAVYALVGALTLFVSRNVSRYAALIAFSGRLTVILGVFFTVLGIRAGLPSAWAWFEGPPTIVLGLSMTYLAGRTRDR